MNYSRNGEDGIRIVFGDTIDLEIHSKVRQYSFFLASLGLREIIDVTPSFRSVLIHFDCNLTTFHDLSLFLRGKEREIGGTGLPEPTLHEIPVIYGGEYGPDMEFVCSYSGLTEDEVVELHTETAYTVFTVGFTPGFPYMGILDRRLYAPRLETPRLKVPEGSVGIAQLQTGIYSVESPAGWRIIGKTEIKLLDPSKEPFSLLQIGDHVRFIRA